MAARTRDAEAAALRRCFDEALVSEDPRGPLWALVRDDDVAAWFPELPAMAMPETTGRHKDVLAHSVEVAAKTPPRWRVRMAALLHDVGKPATRRVRGREVSFRGHEAAGARIVERRLGELGYPGEDVAAVARIVAMSGRFKEYGDPDADGGWTDSAVRRYARDAGDALDDLLALCEVDVTSRHRWKHQRQRAQVAALRRRIGEVAEADRRAAERPDLDGRQIMRLLDVPPGPLVGEARAMLLEERRRRGAPLGEDEAARLLAAWARRRGVAA